MTADATHTTLPTWSIDSCHSQASFTARHLRIAAVTGILGPITGTLHFDSHDFRMGSAEAFIDVTALSTGHERRDDDLRSAGFFDVEHYPTIWFRSTRAEHVQNGKYLVRGELTLKGVVRSVVLDVTYEGKIADPYGAESVRAGFTVKTAISRKEFAMTHDPLLETGDAVVADTIKAIVHVQVVRER